MPQSKKLPFKQPIWRCGAEPSTTGGVITLRGWKSAWRRAHSRRSACSVGLYAPAASACRMGGQARVLIVTRRSDCRCGQPPAHPWLTRAVSIAAGDRAQRGNSGCSRWRCRCINIRPCRLLTRVAIGITNGAEALLTAHRAADTLAFSKFWYPVRTHAESVVLCPAGIRSLAMAALSMSSGLVAYRSGAGARLSCLSWVRVSWTRRAAGAAMRW